jgi:hypothetical protein
MPGEKARQRAGARAALDLGRSRCWLALSLKGWKGYAPGCVSDGACPPVTAVPWDMGATSWSDCVRPFYSRGFLMKGGCGRFPAIRPALYGRAANIGGTPRDLPESFDHPKRRS